MKRVFGIWLLFFLLFIAMPIDTAYGSSSATVTATVQVMPPATTQSTDTNPMWQQMLTFTAYLLPYLGSIILLLPNNAWHKPKYRFEISIRPA